MDGPPPVSAELSLGAILLFGTAQAIRRWIRNAEFLFQDLRPGDLSANVQIVAPLFRAAQELRALIDERHRVTELTAGMQRIEVPLISSVTRRDAVANALVHRDYAVLGPTRVQFDGAEFVVSSPGGLPPWRDHP